MRGFLILLWLLGINCGVAAQPTFPNEHWETRPPEQAGLSSNKLAGFRELVGGRGCVVRHGAMVFT